MWRYGPSASAPSPTEPWRRTTRERAEHARPHAPGAASPRGSARSRGERRFSMRSFETARTSMRIRLTSAPPLRWYRALESSLGCYRSGSREIAASCGFFEAHGARNGSSLRNFAVGSAKKFCWLPPFRLESGRGSQLAGELAAFSRARSGIFGQLAARILATPLEADRRAVIGHTAWPEESSVMSAQRSLEFARRGLIEWGGAPRRELPAVARG